MSESKDTDGRVEVFNESTAQVTVSCDRHRTTLEARRTGVTGSIQVGIILERGEPSVTGRPQLIMDAQAFRKWLKDCEAMLCYER